MRPRLSPKTIPTLRKAGVGDNGTIMQRIFDGHNDVLSGLSRKGDTTGEGFFEGGSLTHLDLPRAREGGLAGGFFAIWSPGPNDSLESVFENDGELVHEDPIDAVPEDHARGSVFKQAELAVTMAEHEDFRLCLTADDIEKRAKKSGDGRPAPPRRCRRHWR